MENENKYRNIIIVAVVIVMAVIMLLYQNRKQGFHEDEIFTIGSSVNQYDGLLYPYGEKDANTLMCEKYIFDDNFFVEFGNAVNYIKNMEEHDVERDKLENSFTPVWRTREDVENYITLTPNNFFNMKAIYYNQLKDTHPPLFYLLVHFSSMIFGGHFTKYAVFIVNILAFLLSCFVIKKILDLLDKKHLTIGTLVFYGLSMGTITMVLYQRMYAVLTVFVLLYFYYNLKLYRNGFEFTKEYKWKIGLVTVLGFLTQYNFAIYAFLIFGMMIIKMIMEKEYKNITKYVLFHVLYAIIGLLIFVPCLYHLVFNDRGIVNLDNTGYFECLKQYIKHLLYMFTIQDNVALSSLIGIVFAVGFGYAIKKSREKFVLVLTFVPSVIYFLAMVKLTSYIELRYIMSITPFIALTLFLALDEIIKSSEYKELIIVVIATVLIIPGLVYSKPKFLYEEYKECLQIAENNKDKSFVFVYDNTFNHEQSVPEMLIYKRTLILNTEKNELQYCINDEGLNKEQSFILLIKTYMNNEEIISEILNKTDFKASVQLYNGGESSEVISNNIYLISK